MDARDNSLRSRSVDFGNFIADSVKAGMHADLAIINAGSFRIEAGYSGFQSPYWPTCSRAGRWNFCL